METIIGIGKSEKKKPKNIEKQTLEIYSLKSAFKSHQLD